MAEERRHRDPVASAAEPILAASRGSGGKGQPPEEGQRWQNFLGAADKAMVGLCEFLALLFGLPFGEDLHNNKPVTPWNYFYLAIAIIFAVTGPMWPWLRTREWIPEGARVSLSKAPLDGRIWIVTLLLLFVYGTGPEIYRRAAQPFTSSISQQPKSIAAPNTPILPSFPQRSQADAEKERVVIDRVLEILTIEAMPLTDKAHEFVSEWWSALADPTRNQSYGQDLENLIVEMSSTNVEINSVIQAAPQFCNLDLCSVIVPNSSFNDLQTHLSDLQIMFVQMRSVTDSNRLKQLGTNNFPAMKSLFDEVENDIIAYRD
jgi:hypothetical protein